MNKVLANSNTKKKVGAYRLQNRKKIAICTENEHGCITVRGYFNSEFDADVFMDVLAHVVGAKMDGKENENGENAPC